MNTSLPCRLGGVVTVQAAPGGQWSISHTSGPARVMVPTHAAAWIVAAGLAEAATYGEVDSYAPGLLTQGMAPIDRFLADPDNEPSPGGIAALRAMFR